MIALLCVSLTGCSATLSTGAVTFDVKAINDKGEVIASHDWSVPGFKSTTVINPDKAVDWVVTSVVKIGTLFGL
jgi:hypothetical protein